MSIKHKLTKIGLPLGLMIVTLLVMLLPASINQIKWMSFVPLKKARENFYYFLVHVAPVGSSFLLLLLIVAGILAWRKSRLAGAVAFSAVMIALYAFVFLTLSHLYDSHEPLGTYLDVFWKFYGAGYILSVVLILILLIWFYRFCDQRGRKNF